MNVIPFNINPNAKEPADKDKPRRPLSAYNLFFRFKRQKILEACEESDINRETVESIVSCTPGLENVSHDAVPDLDEEELGKFRSDRIRAELGDKLTPKEADEAKARAHRKTQFKHGLSFLEMTKIISSSWKECDDISKKIFQTLAEDGRNIRQQLLEDYTKAREEKSDSSSGSCNKQAMLAKSFDKVRPNAIHKPAAARKMKAASQSVERVDEEISAETHGANMNSKYTVALTYTHVSHCTTCVTTVLTHSSNSFCSQPKSDGLHSKDLRAKTFTTNDVRSNCGSSHGFLASG